MRYSAKKIGFTSLSLALLVVTACSSKPELLHVQEFEGVQFLTLESPAVAENTNGQKSRLIITVYLPPGYRENTERSYPVLYYFPGYEQHAGSTVNFAPRILDAYFAEHPEEAFVMVEVEGYNKYGGSYWTDSPITGGWETFAVEEVPYLIEKEYRVKKGGRWTGIAGLSMGGFAAINLGMKHPERYGHIYSLNPAIRPAGEMSTSFRDCRPAGFVALVAAFVPDLLEKGIPPGTDVQELARSLGYPEPEGELCKLMDERFGWHYLESLVENYKIPAGRQQSILIEYGSKDHHAFIRRGAREFSRLLASSDIRHKLRKFDGGHTAIVFRFEPALLPFFAGAFWQQNRNADSARSAQR